MLTLKSSLARKSGSFSMIQGEKPMHFCVCMSLACWVEIETIQNKWESSSQTLRSSPLLSFFPQEEDRFYLVNEGPDFLEIERRGGVITQWLLSYSQSSNFLALESPDKVGRRRRREERPDEFLRR